MPRTRLTDNSVQQLTLGVHLALLVLLAGTHRMLRSNGGYEGEWWDVYRFANAICAGVFLAQIGLIAIWAAFSQRASAVRGGVLSLFVPLLAAVHSQVFNDTNFFAWWIASSEDYRMRYAIWVSELSLWAFALCAIGLGLRCAGLCVVLPDSLNTDRRFWQFRLIDIASWVAVVAMVLAAGRWLQGYGWIGRGIQAATWALEGNFLMQGEFATLALLIIAGLLSFKSSQIGLAVMLLAPLVLGLFNDAVRRASLPNGLSILDVTAVMFYTFATVFGGTLLVVRDRGYRLCWRRPWSSPPVAESP